MPYIRYNPNEPGDRERAYGEYFLGFIFLWGSVASIIYYICSLVSMFNGKYSTNILYSSGLLIVMAIIDFFIAFSKVDGEEKKEVSKKYFLFSFGGAIDLAGVIGIIVSINSLCHTGTGTGILICSILGVLIITCLTILLYRKIEGYGPVSIKWVTDEKVSSQINKAILSKAEPIVQNDVECNKSENKYIFCHKCGKRLPDDSEFCSSCGTRLK